MKSIEIAIFRFDRTDIQHALERAVTRGVSVHALIANTNRGGAKELRKLEMELLPAEIKVSRTADDLLRYHYKFMIVDRRVLYVLAFNCPLPSRSSSLGTRNSTKICPSSFHKLICAPTSARHRRDLHRRLRVLRTQGRLPWPRRDRARGGCDQGYSP
jgi:phospholipase D-like protein